MINKITITGADDSIIPEDLLMLSKEFPFVEWGILFSSKRTGTNRYPSKEWLSELYVFDLFLPLAAHLCGDYAKNILSLEKAQCYTPKETPTFFNTEAYHFDRLQINHNFEKNPLDLTTFYDIMEEFIEMDFIFQSNTPNRAICQEIANKQYPNVNFLYDSSGGVGKKLDFLWMPYDNNYSGYAGGLSPDNVEEEIIRINKFVGDETVWIDMETHVRSDNDKLFDLDKVRKVLEIGKKYIKV